jgi:hypothetical protein
MPYTSNMIWSIWRDLPMLLKTYFLVLSIVGIYMLVLAAIIMMRLRPLTTNRPIENSGSVPHDITALQSRTEHLCQLAGTMSYLFGFTLFLSLSGAWMIADNSRIPLGTLILDNFLVDFAFGANVCAVLLILHSVQWFVSSRVCALAEQSQSNSPKND